MTKIAQGALTMVGLNTDHPTVFWNGGIVPNIVGVRVDWEDDEQRVKLRVKHMDMTLYQAIVGAGISVRLGD
jgi:hypothetical protein